MRCGVDFAFTLETKIIMIYLSIFTLIVAIIALVTNKLNAKTPCDHEWVEQENSFKCCKCNKKIPDYLTAHDNTYNETLRKVA
jgi:hypothetical protein